MPFRQVKAGACAAPSKCMKGNLSFIIKYAKAGLEPRIKAFKSVLALKAGPSGKSMPTKQAVCGLL